MKNKNLYSLPIKLDKNNLEQKPLTKAQILDVIKYINESQINHLELAEATKYVKEQLVETRKFVKELEVKEHESHKDFKWSLSQLSKTQKLTQELDIQLTNKLTELTKVRDWAMQEDEFISFKEDREVDNAIKARLQEQCDKYELFFSQYDKTKEIAKEQSVKVQKNILELKSVKEQLAKAIELNKAQEWVESMFEKAAKKIDKLIPETNESVNIFDFKNELNYKDQNTNLDGEGANLNEDSFF